MGTVGAILVAIRCGTGGAPRGGERAGEPTPPMGWSLAKPALLLGSPVVPLIWETLCGQSVSVGEAFSPKIRSHPTMFKECSMNESAPLIIERYLAVDLHKNYVRWAASMPGRKWCSRRGALS